MKNTEEFILCAAYKLPDDYMYPNIQKMNEELGRDVREIYNEPFREVFHIATGWRHCDILWKYGKDVCKSQNSGFMTSKGRFVDREEGMKIAFIAGQVSMNKAIRTGNDDKDFWECVETHIRINEGEENFSPGMRKCIADAVTEWTTLYSEDLY